MPILEFIDVSLNYGNQPALRGVSFSLEEGSYVSIVGRNGAGKSSILKCLLRTCTDWKGSIFVKGRALRSYSQRELARIVGYVPQSVHVAFPIQVYDFVLLGRYSHLGLLETPGKIDMAIVEESLQVTETSQLKERLFSSLSGGERQRVVIAAALAQEPEVLLLDEVAHFLDPHYEIEIQHLLCRLNESRKVTILSVTHDVNRAALHSNRVLAMKDGCVKYDGTPGDFMSLETLREIYDQQFILVQHPEHDIKLVVPHTEEMK